MSTSNVSHSCFLEPWSKYCVLFLSKLAFLNLYICIILVCRRDQTTCYEKPLTLKILPGEGMAPHSSTLAWKANGQRSLVGCSHGVAKSRTRLSDFTFTFHFHTLEKEMATHSSTLTWRIPGTGEPGGLPSMGSHRVRHDWSDIAAAEAARILPDCFLLALFYWSSVPVFPITGVMSKGLMRFEFKCF